MAKVILQDGDIGERPAPVHYVMVVDNDPESAQQTKSILEKHGFEAKIFKDGGQVHGGVATDRPDLVLLKLILSGESGFEICERLKKNERHLPVLIYTEIELEAAQQLASKLGADGYLTKPCEPEVLVQTIHEVADAVWEQQAEEHDRKEKAEIGFRCRCGHRLKEKFQNRGKLVICTSCQTLVQIPEYSAHEMLLRVGHSIHTDAMNDPLKFVSVKCQHCGTLYKLYSSDLETARMCPKCQKRQSGALSIIGAPLSRAAMASSLRVLRILSGKLKGKKLMLPDHEITLGRHRSCELRQDDEGIAPRHCTLKPTPLGIVVNDLGSEAGTHIDHEQITGQALLEPGGLLRVGSLSFRLIGQNRDTNSTTFYDPKKAKAEQKAAEKGVRLFTSDRPTATEAADVIQAHWDIIRGRSAAHHDDEAGNSA